MALKRELIEAVFEPATAVASEGGLVSNVLYVNRFSRQGGDGDALCEGVR